MLVVRRKVVRGPRFAQSLRDLGDGESLRFQIRSIELALEKGYVPSDHPTVPASDGRVIYVYKTHSFADAPSAIVLVEILDGRVAVLHDVRIADVLENDA